MDDKEDIHILDAFDCLMHEIKSRKSMFGDFDFDFCAYCGHWYHDDFEIYQCMKHKFTACSNCSYRLYKQSCACTFCESNTEYVPKEYDHVLVAALSTASDDTLLYIWKKFVVGPMVEYDKRMEECDECHLNGYGCCDFCGQYEFVNDYNCWHCKDCNKTRCFDCWGDTSELASVPCFKKFSCGRDVPLLPCSFCDKVPKYVPCGECHSFVESNPEPNTYESQKIVLVGFENVIAQYFQK